MILMAGPGAPLGVAVDVRAAVRVTVGVDVRVFVGEAVDADVRVAVGETVGTVPDLVKVLDQTGAVVPTL